MTDFTVEAIAGGRLSVSWVEGEVGFHFSATVDGDRLGEITDKWGGKKSGQSIISRRLEGGRGSIGYHLATEERFAPIVAEAREKIDREGLAPKAIQERADRLAEAERRLMAMERRDVMSDGRSGISSAAGSSGSPAIATAEPIARRCGPCGGRSSRSQRGARS